MGARAFNVRRLLIVGLIAVAAATASNAMTAANTVPASNAGSGSAVISGYTVSAVAYQLNATTPGNIDSVTFTLSAAATTVKAKVVSSATAYYSCTVVTGNNWSCSTVLPQATVAAADNLSVIAIQ